MDKPFAAMAIACAWTGFIILIFCFFYFSFNKKQYDKILNNYIERNLPLPAPYSLFFHAGFFGSFGVSYFLCRIRKRKRILFMPTTYISAYDFANSIEYNEIKWLERYYKLSILLSVIYLFFVLMAIIQISIIKLGS
ncbi:hypothetical protein EHW66_02280 [Erwinia psidii]|uniref:hypothetical protein n=1 Tax=Erwinia psidii TaxID=69224 RepID=UPI00226BBA67|nr:hypothetical protein [Erwinia psidii]MCX8958050.1 hypothetical protein [Erwinia psidii]MCX8963875.1 hypothetical protein [Erwinia psidii]